MSYNNICYPNPYYYGPTVQPSSNPVTFKACPANIPVRNGRGDDIHSCCESGQWDSVNNVCQS